MKNLVTSKTPLRISLMGGGSDLPSFYMKEGEGRVISTTIDKYIYITAHKRYDDLIRASYSKTEVVEKLKDLEHNLIRETLLFLNISSGVEIVSISDVTAHGTGLGSSSAYTVGLLNALSERYSKFNLANDACKIEIEKCREPIGKQDQFAAAFGGLNEIVFNSRETVVKPINISKLNLQRLEKNLLLFDTGLKRDAGKILKQQDDKYRNTKWNSLNKTANLVKLVDYMKHALTTDVDTVGEILHEGWNIKRGIVDSITNSRIDDLYKVGLKNGAEGGKLCGAGGGGFILFYVKEENQAKLRKALSHFNELEFKFDFNGAILL